MKISYNWLQNYFEEKLPAPEKVSEGLIFHSFEVEKMDKVENDTIFDIKILPDRAHDCLSHWGIAKEISAIFDLEISSPNGFLSQIRTKDLPLESPRQVLGENLQIEIEDSKCLRYMGRIIRNVKVGESPSWLKEKLKAIGQKSINNTVDSANFAMYDLGQPIHAFDLDKLESPKIIIRNGKLGEKIITLDKKEIDLDESILVIADENNPLAIAGIKGGDKAEVDINTKNIVIEVANFNSTTTRKTSKKVGILTDAVKRYENEITPELCKKVMDAITDLIHNLAGGEVLDIVDVYPNPVKQKIVSVSVLYINKRLGSNFSKKEIESVWNKLNFEFTEENNEFEVTIPFLRIDITGPHDLVEEVIRILGYDKLKEELPVEIKKDDVSKTFLKDSSWMKISLAKHKLLEDGYSEVMTYTFRDKGEVEVLASASGKNFLRVNLSDGLQESIKLNQLNLPLLDVDEVKVFEVGTVFTKKSSSFARGSGEIKEEIHIAYGDKKNIIEITLDEFLEKISPEYSSDYFISILDYSLSSSNLDKIVDENSDFNLFKQWSLYPFITRDIAVWVSEGTSPGKLIEIYKSFGTELLVREPKLFDSFTKNKKTSYAYRLVFQSYDRTLTDEEINIIMTNITDKVLSLGFEVR